MMPKDALPLLTALVLLTACQGRRSVTPTQDDAIEGPSGGAVGDDPSEGAAEPEHAACTAHAEEEQPDPLIRWIPAFPLDQGGAVITFTGPEAQQMEVETAMELRGMADYQALTCGTAVILWIPGIDCDGSEASLAEEVEGQTVMFHLETSCFSVDEMSLRIPEECARGTIPAERCR